MDGPPDTLRTYINLRQAYRDYGWSPTGGGETCMNQFALHLPYDLWSRNGRLNHVPTRVALLWVHLLWGVTQ